jgi:hypothetical protein
MQHNNNSNGGGGGGGGVGCTSNGERKTERSKEGDLEDLLIAFLQCAELVRTTLTHWFHTLEAAESIAIAD